MVLLLNVDRFKTKDQATGELDGGELHTVMYAEEDAYEGETAFKGVQVFKEVVPADALRELRAVPGYYDLRHRRFPVKGGKPVEKLVGLAFVKEAPLF